MTPPDASTSERAYLRLLERLREAADIITGPIGARNARERAEGFRHLTRLLSVGLEQCLEKGDRSRPEFTRWMSPHRKLLGDNPGTYYDSARIDPSLRYRVWGSRGNPTYIGFTVYGTDEDGSRHIVSALDDADMEFEPDGTFEIALGAERPPEAKNFLELRETATDVFVRQYFSDPEHEVPATYRIEAVPRSVPPPPITEGELASRLDEVGHFVNETIEVEATLSAIIATMTPGQLRDGDRLTPAADDEGPPLDMAVVSKTMPAASILYAGHWINDLRQDEQFVIEGTPPKARYWSVQVMTRWMESLDYRHHNVIFHHRNTHLQPDGTFRIVVAHADPGAPNWIETTGLSHLSVNVRALCPEVDELDVAFRRESLRA